MNSTWFDTIRFQMKLQNAVFPGIQSILLSYFSSPYCESTLKILIPVSTQINQTLRLKFIEISVIIEMHNTSIRILKNVNILDTLCFNLES